jgi:hypothetical protein
VVQEDSAAHLEKKSSYKQVSLSEWLPKLLFEAQGLTPLEAFLWGWMKSEVHGRKLNTPDELQARFSDAAAGINEHEDQLRRTTRDLRTRFAKCSEIYGWIFENSF